MGGMSKNVRCKVGLGSVHLRLGSEITSIFSDLIQVSDRRYRNLNRLVSRSESSLFAGQATASSFFVPPCRFQVRTLPEGHVAYGERNTACKAGRRLDTWHALTVSFSGLGHRPFAAVRWVRIPLGSRLWS